MKDATHQHAHQFDWAVIGAGPAGMATIGRLIDAGVPGKRIAWIDPHFAVGDFGTKWRSVSSNTRAGLFVKFLNECESFHYAQCPEKFPLHGLDPVQTCDLEMMAAPLRWVTQQLRGQVVCFQGNALELKSTALNPHEPAWDIALGTTTISSRHVVLAIGSHPKSLALPGVEEISVTDALDALRLSRCFLPTDTVAVFGASHSAIMIIRLLIENVPVRRVVNFYKHPLRYAEYLDGWIRHDDSGLKGIAAKWARENIDARLHPTIERVSATQSNIDKHLPTCTKAVYAVGFSPRKITVNGSMPPPHDPTTGEIAPGLYGVGIAYPEARANRDGVVEHRVGLWKFMEYLGDIVPKWLARQD